MQNLSALLADVLQIEEETLKDSVHMHDCETWDSLKHMELVVSLERAYEIELTADEITAMTSVGEIKTVLRNRNLEIE